MPPDFEQQLLIDPADRALDPIADGLGDGARRRLAQVRNFERRLAAALAIDLPADLRASLSDLPEQLAASIRREASNEPVGPTELEQDLPRALAVPVPETLLAELLALPQQAGPAAQPHPRTAHWFRRGPFALAASLLLGVGLLTGWFGPTAPDSGANEQAGVAVDPLLVATVEHLSHEPFALTRTEPVPQATVASLLAQVGLRLTEPVEVNYAYPCPIGGQRTVHMVMQAGSGPVTVIYFREPGAADVTQFRHAGMQGRALSYGDGMLVMLAASSAEFDRLERIWRGALKA